MRAIDHCAWTNRWSRRAPGEKLLLGGGLLVLALVLPPLTTAPLIIAVATLAAVVGAGVPARLFATVMAIPVGFLLTGAPVLALSLDLHHGVHVALAPGGLVLAAEVTVRSLAAVTCLTFLILTTPLADLLAVLGRCGVPRLVLELMLLTYRLIFVFLERAAAGRRALAARLGTAGFAVTVRSLGLLAAGLFQHSLDKGRRLEIGLAARASDGGLPVPVGMAAPVPARLAAFLAVLAAVAGLALWLDRVVA